MKQLLVLAATALMAVAAHANELDNPTQPNPLQADSTIVVRVNAETGAVEKLELNQALDNQQAETLAQDAAAQFAPVTQTNIRSELDQEAGSSSWFWYCPTYYTYPSWGGNAYYNTGFYNYGYWYNNYYSYNYSGWNYYYYQPYYGYNYGRNRWTCSNSYRRGC